MRSFCLALIGFFACVATAVAQQSPAQPANPAAVSAADRAKLLDAHLLAWQDQMQKITTLQMEGIERIDKDNQLKYVSKWIGVAKYRKPNLAVLTLVREDKREIFEKWICTGAAIYQYAPQEKAIHIHPLPVKKDGQVSEENFLSFLFGMKAEEAKKRYDLQISPGKENDQYYIYIDIRPRDPRDKQDFEQARLVLNKDTYLPRQLWFRHPNQDETTWNIPKAQSGVEIDRREFQAPEPPKGWRMVQGQKPADATPRVIRQNKQ
jgi:TIGR03009 family protein